MAKILQDVSIGDNIEKYRDKADLTQEEVCAQMAILGRPMLQSTYSQIVGGSRNIFVSDLICLCKVLKTDFNQLFEGIEPINKHDQIDYE